MYSLVVLLSRMPASGLYCIAGLVVVAPICTCQFGNVVSVSAFTFVRCIRAPATDHDKLHLHSSWAAYLPYIVIHMLLDMLCAVFCFEDLGKFQI